MPDTIEELQKKIADYERRMGIGIADPAKDGYLVLIALLRQQNDYLRNITIKTLITDEVKGKTAEFERAKSLWEKLPSMIENVNHLKTALKMEGEEKKDTYKAVTAKSIADGED